MNNSSIYHIIYRSKAVGSMNPEALQGILAASRRNNPPRQVTGLLIYRQGYFLQLLEGPEGAVAERFSVIMRDDRHEDVEILIRTRSDKRIFADWGMGYLDESASPSGVKVEIMNQLHDYAVKNAKPADTKTILTILNSFKNGCRDLSSELPA
jgi:hypothetical protein